MEYEIAKLTCQRYPENYHLPPNFSPNYFLTCELEEKDNKSTEWDAILLTNGDDSMNIILKKDDT